MSRILTGIQASGKPHLGNLLGAIFPAIELSKDLNNECFFFIADLHAMTTVKNPKLLKANTYCTAAAWLAAGLNTKTTLFYRQSRVPEVSELTWYFNTLTPFPMLANSHAFKSKSEKLSDVNAGLLTYPILMAADILLYDAILVPVGKDQIQHIEIARDIASIFNQQYGETFILPTVKLTQEVGTILGTDGQKMSKSYHNIIDIFQSDKDLKKQVMSILSDSKGLAEPKEPNTCNVFKIFEQIATKQDVALLRQKYLEGNYGYGQAKNDLFEVLIQRFSKHRSDYQTYIENTDLLDKILAQGEAKASLFALNKLKLVREKIGF